MVGMSWEKVRRYKSHTSSRFISSGTYAWDALWTVYIREVARTDGIINVELPYTRNVNFLRYIFYPYLFIQYLRSTSNQALQ